MVLQFLQNFAKFQKFQLDHQVDFEKCCKTHIYLQRSVPIQPKASEILPKFCQTFANYPTRSPRSAGLHPTRLPDQYRATGTAGSALLQASLPVVDNNRKVVGALSVVGEAPPKIKTVVGNSS